MIEKFRILSKTLDGLVDIGPDSRQRMTRPLADLVVGQAVQKP
jgi:hypothetical protein